VELALVLPAVCAVVLLAVQVVLLGRDRLLVVHAAREAARAAAVDPRPAAAARQAALAAGPLDAGRLTVQASTRERPGMVVVRVRFRSATDVPLVGPLLPDADLRATAAMRVEHGALKPARGSAEN
jgi:Flp pilus assembly protein TadG